MTTGEDAKQEAHTHLAAHFNPNLTAPILPPTPTLIATTAVQPACTMLSSGSGATSSTLIAAPVWVRGLLREGGGQMQMHERQKRAQQRRPRKHGCMEVGRSRAYPEDGAAAQARGWGGW